MKVTIEKEGKQLELAGIGTGSSLLEKLGIIPSTVIIVRGDEVILPSEKLAETDEIRILSVVSGG